MSNIVEFPNREHIYDQASSWIAKLDRDLNTDEEKNLKQWLQQNPEHRRVFFEMAALWDKMDSLGRLADLFEAPQPQRHKATGFYGAIAACFVFAALALMLSLGGSNTNTIMAWINGKPGIAVVNDIYETAIGEHSSVNLPDGSQLVLNTNSRVRVKYTAEHRLFLLERGEINIEVAHDKSRPLSVMARDKVVQAVGTAFNVRIHNEREVELIVTDGKVLVAKQLTPTHTIEEAKTERLTSTSMAVSKGEKIVLGTKQEKIAKVADADIAATLSWRQGNIVFRGETLEQALNEISRYTSIEFEVVDDSIKQERIAGLFKAGDINGLLTTLDQNFNIHNQRIGSNKIRLSAR